MKPDVLFGPFFLSNLTHVEPFITKRSSRGPPSMGTITYPFPDLKALESIVFVFQRVEQVTSSFRAEQRRCPLKLIESVDFFGG